MQEIHVVKTSNQSSRFDDLLGKLENKVEAMDRAMNEFPNWLFCKAHGYKQPYVHDGVQVLKRLKLRVKQQFIQDNRYPKR